MTSLHLMTGADRPVAERLWQLYAHDMSQFRGTFPADSGEYKAGRLPTFFEDPDRCGYLVRTDDRLAGFAFVRGVLEEPRVMGEFFVVRAARRHGVGHAAASAVLREHPGRWEIPFQEENPGAARFWRQVATKTVGEASQPRSGVRCRTSRRSPTTSGCCCTPDKRLRRGGGSRPGSGCRRGRGRGRGRGSWRRRRGGCRCGPGGRGSRGGRARGRSRRTAAARSSGRGS